MFIRHTYYVTECLSLLKLIFLDGLLLIQNWLGWKFFLQEKLANAIKGGLGLKFNWSSR